MPIRFEVPGLITFDYIYTKTDSLFPEWADVITKNPVVLEGVVVPKSQAGTDPHLVYEDMPNAHFTHDFTFFVKPDPQYSGLLRFDPPQPYTEVEWESGLTADNSRTHLRVPMR